MDNIQVLRYIANIESRIKTLENANNPNIANINNLTNSIIPTPVDLTDVNNRIANLEGRPPVDLSELHNRIANLENRPDVMQRLSALELTVASLNASS